MAKVLAIGQPVNDAERIAIAHLRDHLPDSFTVLHNFRIDRQGESFEIDIALLAPHALYVIDVKGTRGLIDVHGPKWYPEGRSPFPSPLAKLQSHAKAIKGIVTASHPGRQELDYIHVAAAILLTAPDAHLVDPADIDARGVVKLKDAERYFKDTTQVPAGRNKAISGLHSLISHALHLKAKPTTGRPKYGHWQVLERLGASKTYTESRAQNVFAGGTARVRLYTADPYQPEQQRKAEMHRIANAYKALSALPMHANIVAARDFFEVEDDQAYVLVLDDAAGQALTVHMARPQLALTVDQKWRVAKDLLAALAHAHRHGVIHRNLTPAALIVGPDGMTRVTDFDYARPSADRSATIAGDIVDLVDVAYVAPEAYREPGAATAASDIFSAGLILYELLTGEKPFNGNPQTVFDTNGRFPTPASQIESGLTAAADAWLQSLCEFEADKRPNAEQALAALVEMLAPAPPPSATVTPAPSASAPEPESSFADIDPRSLPQGFQLTRKFLVERKLGQGTFGVVYKVIDTLGDVARVVKLVVSDRHSPLDRLKREYGHLVKVPDHPNVVKVLDADVLPWGQGEQIPYMVFEYVEGSDVAEMIQQRLLAPEDALELGKQVVDGLVHLHSHGFHHCDIKPRNLLWTTKGAKIIDFNVSVRADDREARGGGSRRYLPPDFDPESVPQNGERADRDLYALGLTLYEAVTGRYPWSASEPPPNQPVPDPRELSGFDDLVPELVDVIMRTVAPKRSDRWHSAQDLKQALANVHQARRAVVRATLPLSAVAAAAATGAAALTPAAPNTNPFVAHLLSLYSQSARSNAGTRGMDAWGETVYVATDLDRKLLPAVLAGEFRLVLITGNAGDGKTAFLQHLEREVERQGGTVNRSLPNGSAMQLGQRRYLINYDGSQDEGSKGNDDVLREFMGPFSGVSAATWAPAEVRLIAINEGRLVDFLASYEADFPALKQLVQTGLATGDASGGVAVVNLNLRSVVAPSDEGSILERTIKRMTDPAHWLVCEQCDLKDSCYALHNARSFQDETAGPRLVERLQTLYTMTHLRGKLHITMRDLRSALSFMLISNRDCADIHALYGQSDRNAIVRSFYFNSWLGGGRPTADRLISLLAEVDVGRQEDPRFDRGLDFVQPDDRMLFRFERRANFDFKVLQALFEDLPRGAGVGTIKIRATRHREYVAMTRRKQFFERRDGTWERMLPYRSAKRMVDIVRAHEPLDRLIPQLLNAINRGEGLQRPERLGDNLALQLRHVENGTVRSYRLFPSRQFSIQVEDFAAQARFMEHLPTGLRLRFRPEGKQAMASDLVLNLDVFEMLTRLNEGYRPSVEEMQGYYLSLAVFKNSLNAQPYREILLTTTGHDFYRVARRDDGLIEMQLAKHEREMA